MHFENGMDVKVTWHLSCEQQQEKGPDISPLKILIHTRWFWLWFASAVVLAPIAAYFFDRCGGFGREIRRLAFGSLSIQRVILNIYAVSNLMIAMAAGLTLALMPAMTKFQIQHLERDILFCLPIPDSSSFQWPFVLHFQEDTVALSTYMVIAYGLKMVVFDIKPLFTARRRSPSDAALTCPSLLRDGINLLFLPKLVFPDLVAALSKVSEYEMWLFNQAFDSYTEWIMVYSIAGVVPDWMFWWWVALSAFSMGTWISCLPLEEISSTHYACMLRLEQWIKDLGQIMLVLLMYWQGLTIDQYVIFNFAGKLLGFVKLALTLYRLRGDTQEYESLDASVGRSLSTDTDGDARRVSSPSSSRTLSSPSAYVKSIGAISLTILCFSLVPILLSAVGFLMARTYTFMWLHVSPLRRPEGMPVCPERNVINFLSSLISGRDFHLSSRLPDRECFERMCGNVIPAVQAASTEEHLSFFWQNATGNMISAVEDLPPACRNIIATDTVSLNDGKTCNWYCRSELHNHTHWLSPYCVGVHDMWNRHSSLSGVVLSVCGKSAFKVFAVQNILTSCCPAVVGIVYWLSTLFFVWRRVTHDPNNSLFHTYNQILLRLRSGGNVQLQQLQRFLCLRFAFAIMRPPFQCWSILSLVQTGQPTFAAIQFVSVIMCCSQVDGIYSMYNAMERCVETEEYHWYQVKDGFRNGFIDGLISVFVLTATVHQSYGVQINFISTLCASIFDTVRYAKRSEHLLRLYKSQELDLLDHEAVAREKAKFRGNAYFGDVRQCADLMLMFAAGTLAAEYHIADSPAGVVWVFALSLCLIVPHSFQGLIDIRQHGDHAVTKLLLAYLNFLSTLVSVYFFVRIFVDPVLAEEGLLSSFHVKQVWRRQNYVKRYGLENFGALIVMLANVMFALLELVTLSCGLCSFFIALLYPSCTSSEHCCGVGSRVMRTTGGDLFQAIHDLEEALEPRN